MSKAAWIGLIVVVAILFGLLSECDFAAADKTATAAQRFSRE
jgi:hypothetical protein